MTRQRPLVLALFVLSMARTVGAQEPPSFLMKWGSYGTGNGQFNAPTGVAIDANGDVYVSELWNGRIQKFTRSGTFITKWGVSGSGDGQFNWPSDVSVDANGVVYVADRNNHRIQKFTSDGTFIGKWGSFGSGDGQLNLPYGIAFDASGDLYVTELGNDRVQKLTSDGTFITKWGAFGSGDGQFNEPYGIAVHANGNVYVADNQNHRIQKFTSNGIFVAKWGAFGSGDGQFNGPVNVAIDAIGSVFVAEFTGRRIQQFTSTGAFLTKWGSPGTGDGQFAELGDLAFNAIGDLYVADYSNYRVQVFRWYVPRIVSATDVRNDQGGQLRIRFERHRFDALGSSVPILQYEAFRRIDPLTASKIGASAADRDPERALGGMRLTRAVGMVSDPSVLVAGWEFVGAVPAHGESEYNMIAPTLVDSTASGIRWSVFFMRAATAVPTTFFDGRPDSGYSIDNLAPNVPLGLQVSGVAGNGDVQLTWSPSEEQDFRFFSLYRGSDPDFVPATANRISNLTGTTYTDPSAGNPPMLPVYYKLSATDLAGNQSGFAVTGLTLTDVDPSRGGPQAFSVRLCMANPARGRVAVEFNLPMATLLHLGVYDARGSLVRCAAKLTPYPAGRHQWVWDLLDDGASPVHSGVYFLRMRTPQFSRTIKTVVVE